MRGRVLCVDKGEFSRYGFQVSAKTTVLRGVRVPLLLALFGFACEASDAGVEDAGVDASVDAGVEPLRIFVTDTAQDADFGGIAGADALCASQASEAGLDGEFRAWLSSVSSPVAARVTQSSRPYVLVDGTVIADDWADLTDGEIRARINLDARGDVRSGDVWTGTLPDGSSYTNDAALDAGVPTVDCEGFTSGSGGVGLCGTTGSVLANWTANQTPDCATRLRLFCIEQ